MLSSHDVSATTEIYHINCLRIISPIADNVCGHCMLIHTSNRLILIDTGIGLLDIKNPQERIGQELIESTGYYFDENQTALRQLEKLGFNKTAVTDCIISHLDNDHIGGLADFPNATIHLAIEELQNFHSQNPRYLKQPLSHNPAIITYENSNHSWYGLEARKIAIDIGLPLYLVPLFGHTLGHCGIALESNEKPVFFVGDAYYLRDELSDKKHPVSQLAALRADDNKLRIESLTKIKNLIRHNPEITIHSYHDINEFNHYQQA